MRRGTTPTHTFKVPVDLRNAEVVYMTYKQGDLKVVEKTKEDMEIFEDKLELTLTQQETLGFSTDDEVEIQCRARYADGAAIGSKIKKVPVCKVLKEGVI